MPAKRLIGVDIRAGGRAVRSRLVATALVMGIAVALPGLAAPPMPHSPALEAGSGTVEGGGADDLRTRVRTRVETLRAQGRGSAAGARIHAVEALPAFYEARLFEPAWLGGSELPPRVEELSRFLAGVERDGLSPEDYHQVQIDSLLALVRSDGASETARTDLELLLTDAFLLVGSHLHGGRVNPESVQPEWIANRRGTDMAQVLRHALDGGGIRSRLESLRPGHAGYRSVMQALEGLRSVAARGGWGSVPAGERLEVGSEGERVARLRSRLRASGDLRHEEVEAARPERFDAALDAAVRRFQRRHGLDADGVVGPRTLAALNVSAEERVRQLEVNLERWRWLPDELGRRHILVNIAGFTVDVVEDGERVDRFRAIVGRGYRQTPAFSDRMTYLVFAPYWHVPPGIAANDQLPRIRSDPEGYLASQNMVLLEQGTNRPVEPASVDWSAITGAEFNRRYRIRQDPGPDNALGAVKFMFPNRYNVYLHDSPGRDLFDRTVRDFSSGCVRVERALDLAEYLLRDDPSWDRQRVERAAAAPREQSVRLPEAVPVHLQYWTAWIDREGALQLREDIYNRDVRVSRALEASAPGL